MWMGGKVAGRGERTTREIFLSKTKAGCGPEKKTYSQLIKEAKGIISIGEDKTSFRPTEVPEKEKKGRTPTPEEKVFAGRKGKQSAVSLQAEIHRETQQKEKVELPDRVSRKRLFGAGGGEEEERPASSPRRDLRKSPNLYLQQRKSAVRRRSRRRNLSSEERHTPPPFRFFRKEERRTSEKK